MRGLDLAYLRAAYERGENITRLLGNGDEVNSIDAVEISYDLQAGSYIKGAFGNQPFFLARTEEMGEILASHISFMDILLDCGTGELTTLSGCSRFFPAGIKLLAFDLSLSRLNVGLKFASNVMRTDLLARLEAFSASMDCIPLPDNSVDVVTTSHALEPNFGREYELLSELLRICRKKLILFEPSYEDNTDEGRERMRAHGYVRELPKHIEKAGGKLIDKFPLKNVSNPLNPTFCYVVEKDSVGYERGLFNLHFRCPVTKHELQRRQGYFWSKEGGYAYPIIGSVPLLRTKDAILMCHE